MSFDSISNVKDALRKIATECAKKGPGHAQEGVVLREARSKLYPTSIDDEQMMLEAWHDLFAEGELGWGYNLDNPGRPFFHVVVQRVVSTVGSE